MRQRINRIISVIEGIEPATREPFNRFSDTSETHEIELNYSEDRLQGQVLGLSVYFTW